MDKATDLRALIESALQQMEHNGASASMLKDYREIGFGAIRRHFKRLGQSEFATEATAAVIFSMENGTTEPSLLMMLFIFGNFLVF